MQYTVLYILIVQHVLPVPTYLYLEADEGGVTTLLVMGLVVLWC